MGAKMTFADLPEGGEVAIDDGLGGQVHVTTARGNHPQGVFAFRVVHAGKVVSVTHVTRTIPGVDEGDRW